MLDTQGGAPIEYRTFKEHRADTKYGSGQEAMESLSSEDPTLRGAPRRTARTTAPTPPPESYPEDINGEATGSPVSAANEAAPREGATLYYVGQIHPGQAQPAPSSRGERLVSWEDYMSSHQPDAPTALIAIPARLAMTTWPGMFERVARPRSGQPGAVVSEHIPAVTRYIFGVLLVVGISIAAVIAGQRVNAPSPDDLAPTVTDFPCSNAAENTRECVERD